MNPNNDFLMPRIKKVSPKKHLYTKNFISEREREMRIIEVKLKQQRENVNKEFCDKEEILEIYGKKLIYDNQKQAAIECKKAFDEGALIVCLVAQPGTGKTGTAHEVMRMYATDEDDTKIKLVENMYIVSGMCDNDWEKQFRDNLINSFKGNVFHRQNFIKQIERLKYLRNGLIIIDECHIASGSKMTLKKALEDAGILNTHVLKNRNIKILDISATPEGILHDLEKWDDKKKIVKIMPGQIYKGFQVMLNEGRIIDTPSLDTYEEVEKFLSDLDKRYINTSKKYFPFRIIDENTKLIIEDVCEKLEWAEPLHHNSEDRIEDIDEKMETAPLKHTPIFIKGFWRASKRLVRHHIGATYESKPKKQDMTSTSQGLTPRNCDNYEYSGDQLDINKRPLHYCDKNAIEKYVEWFNKDCNYKLSEYKSSRIKSNGEGKVTSKPTINHESVVIGVKKIILLEEDQEEEKKEEKIKNYRIYDSEEKTKSVCKKLEYAYRKAKVNTEGFLETSLNGPTAVVNLENVIKKIHLAYGGKGAHRTYYPCYVNTSDKNTLRFVVIIRPTTDKSLLEEVDKDYPSIRES
jgi:hypothetical protein